MRFKLSYTIFFLLISWKTMGQILPHENFQSSFELSTNKVYDLLVDHSDNLWIATDNGLIKKQNSEFISRFDTDGLSGSSVWAIVEDRNGVIWAGTYGQGLSFIKNNEVSLYEHNSKLIDQRIRRLYTSGDLLFVGTENGLSVIDVVKRDIWSLENTLEENLVVSDFFKYKEDVYFTTYRTGIFKVIFSSNRIHAEQVNSTEPIYAAHLRNNVLYLGSKGNLVAEPIDSVIQGQDYSKQENLHNPIFFDFVDGPQDKIYAAAWGMYNNEGGLFEIKENGDFKEVSSMFGVKSRKVKAVVYHEAFNQLFSGTMDLGVTQTDLNSIVSFYPNNSSETLGFALQDNSRATLTNDGISFDDGRRIMNSFSREELKWFQNRYVLEHPDVLNQKNDFWYELDFEASSDRFTFYRIISQGAYFYLNTSIGIYKFSRTGVFQAYMPVHAEIISSDNYGNIMDFHPYHGVRIYKDFDKDKNQYYHENLASTPKNILDEFRGKDKSYFVSATDGLFSFDGESFKSYVQDSIFLEKNLKHVEGFKKDHLIVGTVSGNVYILHDGSGFEIIKKIKRQDIIGSSINYLSSYEEFVLIGTDKGLTIYDGNRFFLVDQEQGLKPPFYGIVKQENCLLIGSTNGYYVVSLDKLKSTKSIEPQLNVEGYNLDGIKYNLQSRDEKIQLVAGGNNLIINFEVEPHPYPKKLKYRYRLGEEDSWKNLESPNQIILDYIPHDINKIQLNVSDLSTGSKYVKDLVYLKVIPPFYLSWWFWFGLFLVIVSAHFFNLYLSRKRIKQRASVEKRFEAIKLDALLSQMNPHFIFNAMNSIQSYILVNDIERASQFLGDFSNLMRKNLDFCTKQEVLVVELLEFLREYVRVENSRFNNKIKVIFEIDPKINIYSEVFPTMIIQPFIENVFSHAFTPNYENPKLNIVFTKFSDGIEIQIIDNGVGLSSFKNKIRKHQSKGISIVRERLVLFGFDVSEVLHENYHKNGTTITLRIPTTINKKTTLTNSEV